MQELQDLERQHERLRIVEEDIQKTKPAQDMDDLRLKMKEKENEKKRAILAKSKADQSILEAQEARKEYLSDMQEIKRQMNLQANKLLSA